MKLFSIVGIALLVLFARVEASDIQQRATGKFQELYQLIDERLKELTEIEKADQNDAQQAYIAQTQQRNHDLLQSLKVQLKKAEHYHKRGNAREARETYERLESQITPLLPADHAIEIIIELADELEKVETTHLTDWYKEITSTMKETQEKALTAEDSADLNDLLLKVAALEMSRPQSSHNVLVTRGSEQLQGIVGFLNNYMKYLDQKNAGNAQGANKILESIRSNFSGVPILTQEQLDEKWLPTTGELSLYQITADILKKVDGPEDLEGAIEAIAKAETNPRLMPGGRDSGSQALHLLESLRKGFAAIENGDVETALKISVSLRNYTARPEYKNAFDRILEMLGQRVLEAKLGTIVDLKADAAVTPSQSAQLDGVLKRLWDDGDYSNIVKLLQLRTDLKLESQQSDYITIKALNNLLAAQRFERANDPISAYVRYREVIEAPADEMIPHDLAVDAIKRLRKDHPQMIKNFDDSALFTKLDELGKQIKMSNLHRGYR
ncbi:hypothetical protein ACFSSA_06470 [Luteolibacter algae]|uniref:Uncharacterized protein n=1 Tax=Luteolibacter algae TaxID=454151 RepID=A0ABW5D9L7_9BACT